MSKDKIEAKVATEFTVTSYTKDAKGKTTPAVKTYKVGSKYSGPQESIDLLVKQGKLKTIKS